jgi:HEAT repeat protein
MLERFLTAIAGGDDALAEQAAQELGLLPAENQFETIEALLGLLQTGESDMRWWAVRGLSAIQNERIPAILAEFLNDPSAAVRQAAALGLRLQPDEKQIPVLLSALENQDRLTGQLAAQALSAVGSAAVEPLLSFLSGCSPQARGTALRTLVEIGDERSLAMFYNLLDDESILVQHWANEGLERLGVGMVFFKP